jgi:outer membrane usher protein
MAQQAAGERSDAAAGADLYLEVFVDNVSTGLIGNFRRRGDGSFAVAPDELQAVGVMPAADAAGPDGWISLDGLPGVAFRYDEPAQAMHFTLEEAARAPREIDAGGDAAEEAMEARSGFGGVLNYTLFASAGGALLSDLTEFEGLSGSLEGRLFSPYGTLASSIVGNMSAGDSFEAARLDTAWSYSDPESLLTYRAGDTISGGLAWTRPVRLGGVQVQRNFALRPDLITLPLPSFSGSAAVPSTLDVYADNVRVFSGEVPAGPFEVDHLPVVTGAGTARVVVTDALGREIATEHPFFVGADALRGGLFDFSMEAGLPRRSYGTESFDYAESWLASGTLRYGWRDWLTLETHAEGGAGLINGGAGAVFPLGRWGAGSLALAASQAGGDYGLQLSASVDLDLGNASLFARTQRTFGAYRDVASLSAGDPDLDALPPKALEQLVVNFPLAFDPASFSLGLTHLDSADEEESWIGSVSLNRPLPGNAALYASAFVDFADGRDSGVYLGYSVPLGGASVGSGVEVGPDGASAYAEASRPDTLEPGSFGWRVRTAKGEGGDHAVGVAYRTGLARLEAGAVHSASGTRATAQMDGAIVLAGGGLFLANRIDDAFAVVDAGAPGIDVLYENRPVGTTGRSGRLVVPGLRSYQPNAIAIDPKNLPVDAVVPLTEDIVVPADRSGIALSFGVSTSTLSAVVEFQDAAGGAIEAGSSGVLEGGESFFVGYDGQAYVTGLRPGNVATIARTDGSTCTAEFAFTPKAGVQVQIPAIRCVEAEPL